MPGFSKKVSSKFFKNLIPTEVKINFNDHYFICLLQPVIIDGRGHLLGRLAAIVAKTLLQGILT